MLHSSENQEAYFLNQVNEKSQAQILREQIIRKQLKLEKQIGEMERWLNENNMAFYENLLKEQTRLYEQMQELLKENEFKRISLSRREKEKQLLLGKIEEYDEQIERVKKIVDKILEEMSKLKGQELKKLKKEEKCVFQEKKRELKINMKERGESVKKVNYLKDKINRVEKMIEGEYCCMRSKQRNRLSKSKTIPQYVPQTQKASPLITSPFLQNIHAGQIQIFDQNLGSFQNSLQKYPNSQSPLQTQDKDGSWNHQINQFLSI